VADLARRPGTGANGTLPQNTLQAVLIVWVICLVCVRIADVYSSLQTSDWHVYSFQCT